MTHGGNHAALAGTYLSHGISVVSCSDRMADVLAMLDLQDRAVANNAVLIPGAACMPGLSGLLVAHAARAFDQVDEAHLAVHGTGGPACARNHHDALSGTSVGWHDGEWLQRPAGSGRELRHLRLGLRRSVAWGVVRRSNGRLGRLPPST